MRMDQSIIERFWIFSMHICMCIYVCMWGSICTLIYTYIFVDALSKCLVALNIWIFIFLSRWRKWFAACALLFCVDIYHMYMYIYVHICLNNIMYVVSESGGFNNFIFIYICNAEFFLLIIYFILFFFSRNFKLIFFIHYNYYLSLWMMIKLLKQTWKSCKIINSFNNVFFLNIS